MDLRVLLIEDNSDDAELILCRLREAGFEPRWNRVASEAELRAAVTAGPWDVALVDFNLPGFGGPHALRILAAEAPDVPAVTVSGAIDEDTAVRTIRAGAVDYVLKDNLTRLAPAVQRAVEGAELRRRERRSMDLAHQTQFAIEHSSQATAYINREGVIVYANEAAQRFGLNAGPAGRWSPVFAGERWSALWARALQHPVVGLEIPVDVPDARPLLVATTLEYCGRGDDPFVIVYARDIAIERETERRAVVSEAMYRRVLQVAGEGVWVFDRDHKVTFVNPQMAALLGGEPPDVVGRHFSDFIFDDDVADHAARTAERERGAPGSYEARYRSLSGEEIWLAVSTVAEMADDGRYAGAFAMCTDVTERRRAEEALRQSEAQLRTLIDTLPDLVWLKDPDGVYLFCNRRFESFFGALEKDIAGRTDRDFMTERQAEFFRQHDLAAIRAGAPSANEEEIVFADDGHREILETIKTPVHARDGALMGVLGVGRDITERKLAEEEIRRQAEQLRRTVQGAVLAMSHVVEMRDPYTAGHERRVAELAAAIGAELGFTGDDLEALHLAALIHDIGKIAVPAEILAKPGRLSEVEFNLIRQHPDSGYDILEAIDFGSPVAEVVLQHHERLDGSGYPRGLAGEQILPEARIIAVADVVEAMSSHRPYRAALGLEAALDEVGAHAGVRYDADVVAACVRLFKEQGFTLTP